jgi:ribosomal protein L7/L12
MVDETIYAELREEAKRLLASGRDWEHVLPVLRTRCSSPIQSIKVLRELAGLSLADAKDFLDRSDAWADLREKHAAVRERLEEAFADMVRKEGDERGK